MDILEILGRIGFDTKLFVFNIVNFAVIALLLQKFFFKKIASVIEERQAEITEGIQNAETAKSELAMSEQKGQQIIEDAKQQSNQIVKDAAEKAQTAANSIKQKTEGELSEMHDKAKEQIEKQRKQMKDDFKKEATNLVISATEKLLESNTLSKDLGQVEKVINSIDLKDK